MTWRWKWKTVCHAAAPQEFRRLTPSAPSADWARFASRFAAAATAASSSSAICRRSVAWRRGTTSACPRVAGLMSMKATVRSSSSTTVDGSSPATILQKMQLGSVCAMRATLSAHGARLLGAVLRDDGAMPEDNVAALRRLWDAWSRGSVRDIVAVLHPDVEWSSVVLGRGYRGHGDVAAWLDALRRDWKSLTVTFDHAEDAGPDHAVAYGRVRGFGYGGDQSLDTPLIWVAEFCDGLIRRGLVFPDPVEARRHLDAVR